MPRHVFTIAWMATLLSGVASAQVRPAPAADSQPAAIERVTSVEGVTQYRLGNGLQVLLIPDPAQTTTLVNMVYSVGSRQEGYGSTGAAHLLEHMMFKGTPTHPDIPGEMTAHGAHASAGTSYDSTSYSTSFAASNDTLAWALALEADRMINSTLVAKDLDSEMTVVRNEFERDENNPLRVLKKRVRSAAYLWHNYGNALIGARSDLEQIPIERLRAFYRTWYQPNNATLIVAGSFDQAATLTMIGESFGSIPRPARTLPEPYTREPTQDGERKVVLRRAGEGGAVMAAYHVPAGAHPDFAALRILSQVLADAPGGRLYRALVETGKAVAVQQGSINPPLHDPFLLWMVARVRDAAALVPVRDIMVRTMEGVAADPPTDTETERARARLLKSLSLTLRSAQRTAHALGGWIAAGDWRLLFLYRDRLREVTPEDVRRVAASYLRPSNRTVGLFVPDDKPQRAAIPPTPDITALVRGYSGDPTYTAGEPFEASPGNIEAHTTRLRVGGLEVALLPRQTRAHAVSAQLTLRFGDPHNLEGTAAVGMLAAGMLMRGTARHTRQAIEDELNRRQSSVLVLGEAGTLTASVGTTRDHLAAVLELLAEILQRPSFPASEFELLKRSRLAELEQQRGEPQPAANRALRRHLQPYAAGDPRYVPSLDEEIAAVQAVTLQQVRQFHARFHGASHGELALVGDFDADQVGAQLDTLFGDWDSRAAYMRLPCPYRAAPAAEQVLQTPDKTSAVFLAGANLDLGEDDPDYPALLMAGELLGGGFMNSRLTQRLRQRDGLSYGVGASFRAGTGGRCGRFNTSAIAAPENIGKVEAAFQEEIARALRDGFSAAELDAARTGWLQQRRLARTGAGGQAQLLASRMARGRTLAWDAGFEDRMRALTADQVTVALRRHMELARLSVVKAGDFVAQPPTE